MICQRCKHKRKCINGSWCMKLKVYVEHKIINSCLSYEEKDIH